MVVSYTTSITPAQHADKHRTGGTDPLTGAVGIDYIAGKGQVVLSDDLLYANNLEHNIPNTGAMQLIKQIELTSFTGGTLRIKFDIHGDGSGWGRGQIYKNGAAVGTLRERNAGYNTYSEDLGDWIDGDLLQLYATKYSAGTVGAVRNLQIFGRIGDISGGYIYTNNDP